MTYAAPCAFVPGTTICSTSSWDECCIRRDCGDSRAAATPVARSRVPGGLVRDYFFSVLIFRASYQRLKEDI
jgi:hypothetical protein